MLVENHNLKKSLVIQSFAPLFLLLTIKHLHISLYIQLISKFFTTLINDGVIAISLAVKHDAFGELIVSTLGIVWIVIAVVIGLGFNGIQKAGFKASGEQVIIEQTTNDSSATFLVTYVLPLLTDDVSTIRGLIVFLTMLLMVIVLLSRSNTFYQNPVLAAMKYRTFLFKFLNPENDIPYPDRVYVGITHGKPIVEEVVIKRKYISDDVFVIYNE